MAYSLDTSPTLAPELEEMEEGIRGWRGGERREENAPSPPSVFAAVPFAG